MQGTPLVSVIMPAYNAGKYIKEAILSILTQTYLNLEFIIVDDGSADDTASIIQSFTDHRIRFIQNPGNKGLVYSLNVGVEHAQGLYIARMDADDVALPVRIAAQVDYLLQHSEVDMVAAHVALINENGEDIGKWNEEFARADRQSIKKYLAVNNCIAHPTVTGKSTIFKLYRYNSKQPLSEDYDLWLRLANDGKIIDKLPVVLLQHRILKSSFTRTRRLNVSYRIMTVKFIFIKAALQQHRISLFTLRVFLYAIIDFLRGSVKEIKHKLGK